MGFATRIGVIRFSGRVGRNIPLGLGFGRRLRVARQRCVRISMGMGRRSVILRRMGFYILYVEHAMAVFMIKALECNQYGMRK